jgi:hypothetical protein
MPVTASIIIGAIGAATGVGSAFSSAKNRKLQREWEQTVQTLDLAEKKRLADELQKSKDVEEKRRILTETLGKSTETRIAAIEEKKLETQKTLDKLVIIGGVAATVLVVGLIIVYQKRKK